LGVSGLFRALSTLSIVAAAENGSACVHGLPDKVAPGSCSCTLERITATRASNHIILAFQLALAVSSQAGVELRWFATRASKLSVKVGHHHTVSPASNIVRGRHAPMDATDTHLLYEEVSNLWNTIAEKQQEASVVFVDLAGSTEFKAIFGSVFGLEKTFLHNSVVTKIAARHGDVVKYIGDEVMIVVRGAEHAKVACQIGIDIQIGFATLNNNHPNDPRFPIGSKVGIHSGVVQYWKYPGHEPLDPQGNTVDLAARIVSLAKPQQILCSSGCLERLGASALNLSPSAPRHLKGIREPIDVVEIIWDGNARGIAKNALPTSDDPQLRRLVREAREHLRAGNDEAARQAFQAAIEKAPMDFNANLGLGELLARRLGRVKEGKDYLDKACQINPTSPHIPLHEAFMKWQEFRQTNNESCLNEAINLCEECLRLAEINTDYHCDRLARNNLAYYLAERGNDQDVTRAIALCEDVARTCDQLRTRGVSEFLDTYAYALLRRGTKDDVVKARVLLEESIKCEAQNPFPHEHMAELIRKEYALNIKHVSGWVY
jgi:class 3 adenylate cyclase